MEDSRRLWGDALAMIRERVGEHAYDVWFRDTAGEYDAQKNTLVLTVPSAYVYEYIEECRVGMMAEVLGKVFGSGVRLGYRIAPQTAQAAGMQPSDSTGRPRIAVPDARDRLMKGLGYFLGESTAKWIPAYDKVASWLTDNKGKGLLCVGTSGLGKTLICQKILPVILGGTVRSVTSQEMATKIDELLSERIVIVDDIGREPAETWLNYKKRQPFFELCDAAERTGMLLVVTTNLSTTPVSDPRCPSSLQQYYGPEVLSRLRALTHLVVFEGDDMRQ